MIKIYLHSRLSAPLEPLFSKILSGFFDLLLKFHFGLIAVPNSGGPKQDRVDGMYLQWLMHILVMKYATQHNPARIYLPRRDQSTWKGTASLPVQTGPRTAIVLGQWAWECIWPGILPIRQSIALVLSWQSGIRSETCPKLFNVS